MSLATWQDLCLDACDPERMAVFWGPVLGLRPGPPGEHVHLLGDGDHQTVWLNHVDRTRTVKNRLHLDVYAVSVEELVERGAGVLAPAEETGLGWTVMADPEGGEFCAFLREPDALPAYRLHGIGVDCVDPEAQAAWWGRLFGVEPVHHEGEDWHTLEHATPDPVLTLDFSPVPEPRVGPNRVHWDVTGDVAAILAAGATRLWDMPRWTVLADPEGNEFCVFPPDAP